MTNYTRSNRPTRRRTPPSSGSPVQPSARVSSGVPTASHTPATPDLRVLAPKPTTPEVMVDLRLVDLQLVDPPQVEPRPEPPPATSPSTAPPAATPAPVMLPRSVLAFLPSHGLLRQYVECFYPLTEAPAEAHLAAGLAAISGLVGKGVTMPWADDTLYLNLWVSIVGPSTQGRKTTALRKAENLVRQVDATLILPDDTTGAALVDLLAAKDERVWFQSELGVLFSQCEAKHNPTLKQQLANLYDVPPQWGTARRGDRKAATVTWVHRPYVTLLGATTVGWLTSHLTEADLLGGLHARFLYFSLPKLGTDRLISIPPPIDQVRAARILEQATRLYAYTGTVNPDRIRAPYKRWYAQHRAALAKLDDPDRLAAFWFRLESYCLKLAALYQLSVATVDSGTPPPDHDFHLGPEALEHAIMLTDYLKQGLVTFVRQELAPNAREAAHQKILGIVRRRGGRMLRRTLQQLAGLSPKNFQEVLQALTEDGRLVVELQPTEAGQTTVWVRLGEEDANA